MQVEIRIDGAYPEPKVVILTAAVTEEVSQLAKKLSGDAPCILSGMKDGKIEVLEPADLIRVYTSAGKVYAVTEKGEPPSVRPHFQFGDHQPEEDRLF